MTVATDGSATSFPVEEALSSLVPLDSRRVLAVNPEPDALVGCLKASYGGPITGLRPDELDAQIRRGERFSCVVSSGLGGATMTQHLSAFADLLEPDGALVIAVPNALHHEYVRAFLRSDLPDDTWSDPAFGYATTIKRMLDAGFLPRLESVIPDPSPPSFRRAAGPLFQQAGVPPRARKHLDASHHLFIAARRTKSPDQFSATPISFIACVNDDAQLNANLLASPGLAPGSPHQVMLVRGATSIGEAFNRVIKEAKHDIVVLVQQDIYLPWGWDTDFGRGFQQAREKFGPLGVVGLFGVAYRGHQRFSVGKVNDRHKLLERAVTLPARVDGLDEILLAVPRDTSLQIDPALGFHLYGTDLCLQAADRGLSNVVVDAPVFHNSMSSLRSTTFHDSRRTMLQKWPTVRPLHTNMGQLDILTDEEPKVERDPEAILAAQRAEIIRQREKLRRLKKKVEAQRSRISELENSRWRRFSQSLSVALAQWKRLPRHLAPRSQADPGGHARTP